MSYKVKKITALIIASLFSTAIFAKDVAVKGYYKSNGTYVAPHTRSAPNGTTSDNWSTIGNTNPHTGKAGTQPNYKPYTSTKSRSSYK